MIRCGEHVFVCPLRSLQSFPCCLVRHVRGALLKRLRHRDVANGLRRSGAPKLPPPLPPGPFWPKPRCGDWREPATPAICATAIPMRETPSGLRPMTRRWGLPLQLHRNPETSEKYVMGLTAAVAVAGQAVQPEEKQL